MSTITAAQQVVVSAVVVEPSLVGDSALVVSEAADFDAPGWVRVDLIAGGGGVVEVVEVDTDADTLYLASPLTFAVDVDSSVMLVEANGTPVPLSTEVVVATPDGGHRYQTLDPNQADRPLVGAELADVGGVPTPRRVPEGTPPPSTPGIEVTPLPTGLLVTADSVPAGATVTYEAATDAGFTAVVQTLTTANRPVVLSGLTADVDYWLRVTGENALGAAEPIISGPYRTRKLEDGEIASIAADKIVSGDLTAAIALLGSLSVGSSIRLSPDTGLLIELSGGRRVSLGHPTDDPVIEALLTTWGLTSEGNANLLGGNNWLRGSMTIAGGVTAPAVAPTATAVWPTSKRLPLDGAGASHRGVWWDGARWVSVIPTPYFTYVTRWDNAGVLADTQLLTDVVPYGYTRIGDVHYVIGTSGTDGWVVHAYNLSWVRTQRAVIGDLDRIPAITASESSVHVVYANGGTLRRRVYTTTLALSGGVIDVDATWGNVDVDGAVVSQADYGAWYILAVRGSVVRAYTLAGARQTNREFGRPNGETIRGLTWTGSALVALTDAGNVWTYSGVTATTDRSLTVTKYDGDPTGGTHETTASPSRTVSQPARTWLLISTQPVGDSGQSNDPDRPRFYVGNQLQTPDVAEGVTTRLLGVPVTSGIAAPTTNGFAGIGGLNGSLKSEASDGAGPIWSLGGDGPVRQGQAFTLNAAGQIVGGIESGQRSVTITATNTDASVAVTFLHPFAVAPRVIPHAQSTATGVTRASVSNVTTTGFTLTASRTNNTSPVVVDWFAMPVTY